MKNNFIHKIMAVTLVAMLSLSCEKQLELVPISSISDANYWKSPDQFDAFVSGIHARFRTHVANLEALGELRADLFGTEPGSAGTFTGEATQGLERFWQQNLTLDAPGVSNFGGFYTNITQLNLLIDKLNNTNVVTPANKNYYLGIAHGMRAYYYFQLTLAWGDVVIQADPVNSFDVSNLSKPASPAAEVMAFVQADIEKSLQAFGTDYSFRNQKSYWSKAASQMLKAEFYLWEAHRAGGANAATTALNALNEIRSNIAALNLRPTFAEVFASGAGNKGNSEIIFASRHLLNEAVLPFAGTFYPQTNLIANFYDSTANRRFSVVTDNWGGLLRAPVTVANFRRFSDLDSRKLATIQPAYNNPSAGNYAIVGCFVKKFEGEQEQGVRRFTNDYPIYRFADLLLLTAEAKVLLGQSPAAEINLVRARAYGGNFQMPVHGFPNQAGDADAKRALLRERYFEFFFEGKRWLDLRRFGDSFVFEYTSVPASEAYKLLWPIDRNSLTNNRDLKQNPGYPAF